MNPFNFRVIIHFYIPPTPGSGHTKHLFSEWKTDALTNQATTAGPTTYLSDLNFNIYNKKENCENASPEDCLVLIYRVTIIGTQLMHTT